MSTQYLSGGMRKLPMVAGLLMILLGVLLIYKPELLAYIAAAGLISVGAVLVAVAARAPQRVMYRPFTGREHTVSESEG